LRIVALSSGGVDSSVMMLLLKKQGHVVLPLHIDYGHLAREREWRACSQVCKHLGLNEPLRMDLSGFGQIPSGLTNPDLDIVERAFLPGRNMLFTLAGAAYAYSTHADAVAIGLLSNPIFPDQTARFVQSAQDCVTTALGTNIRLLAPLIGLDKRDTLNLARRHNLPLELTYFCHSGKEKPCGSCISCRERNTAEASEQAR
jgi:7-cyano-7-deazaguanine synthase